MKFELSDDWNQDEPLAYLVKNHIDTMGEYKVFGNLIDAIRHSEGQEQVADDMGEPREFEIYPLYAGHPLTAEQIRQFA